MKYYLKILAAVLVMAAALTSSSGCRDSNRPDNRANRAAIIDQLYVLEPNAPLIDEASRILESDGFTVDLWQGNDVTVDFYRKLPGMGYKLILFRVHSGVLLNLESEGAGPPGKTYLFTAEKYTATRYVKDQLTDKVSNAMMNDNYPLVFAVNSEFIEEASGRFADTVVILMGCESYEYADMPAAFVARGAAAYVGWSTMVSLEHVDKAALDLLDNLCTANLTLADGISRTMAGLGPDPSFGAYLKFYPAGSGNQTVKELIRGK